MIEIRSSWIVEDGFARPAGEPALLPRQRGYHCTGCGKKGHSTRTCPKLAAFRARDGGK